MPTFPQRDQNLDDHNMETVVGDAGGENAKVALQAAVHTAIVASAASLASIAAGIAVTSLPAPTSTGPIVAQSTVGTAATQLPSQACKHGVWLRNLDTSQNLAYGNGSGLLISNGYLLLPREEKFIPVANQNQIWIIGSASSTDYCTSAS